jgi:glycosyltransferase involved in cell wall biosynthesis
MLYCVLDKQGGIETHIKSLANCLKSAGAEVTVAAKWVKDPKPYESYFKGIGVSLIYPKLSSKVFALGLPNKLASLLINILAELTFRKSLKLRSFDVVSINATGFFGARLRRYVKPESGFITYHEHQTVHHQDQVNPKLLAILNDMSFVTVNSSLDHKKLFALLKAKTKVYILPALASGDTSLPVLNPKNNQSQLYRVAFVGNVGATEKGAHKLLYLWRLKNIRDMHLTFYGPHSDVLGDIADLPSVKFAGPFASKDIASVYANIDLLVHPADNESLGLVLIEAMAHGVPFVATHVGGIIDIASENSNVLTVENNIEDIYQGIMQMRKRLEMGEIDSAALQAEYEKKWSANVLGKRWVDRLTGI